MTDTIIGVWHWTCPKCHTEMHDNDIEDRGPSSEGSLVCDTCNFAGQPEIVRYEKRK